MKQVQKFFLNEESSEDSFLNVNKNKVQKNSNQKKGWLQKIKT